MLEILQFIFSSFWVWLGTLVMASTLMACTACGVIAAVHTVREKR